MVNKVMTQFNVNRDDAVKSALNTLGSANRGNEEDQEFTRN